VLARERKDLLQKLEETGLIWAHHDGEIMEMEHVRSESEV
jgi:hypothetical protein